ncbi:MAG: DUF4340 domain-containing protein [Polyangiaceae bacterium]|jgi:hypothetical protein
MSREKLIIFGVVLLGILGVLVYKEAKKDESLGAPVAGTLDFPAISAPDDVDKLDITNGEKGEVVLEKVPDSQAASPDAGGATKWVLTKPLQADANQQAVKDLLANLKDLKVDAKINLRLDDAVRKEKQLDTAHALHLVAWKGETKKVDEDFGKSGAAGQLVVVNDKPDAVWAAKGYSSYLYSKEPKDFRDKSIFHFDDANVTDVQITNSHGTLLFTKSGDKWSATLGKRPLERFDQEKIKDFLRTYKSLNADDFGDGKSTAETGLDKPEAEVTIHVNGESKALELSVGKVSVGTNRWVKQPDSDKVVQLASYAADWVVSDASKFETAVDGGALKARAKLDAGKK